MKVAINNSVEVDPDAWAIEFNMEGCSKKEIREDIKNYFNQNWCQEQIQALGLEIKKEGN